MNVKFEVGGVYIMKNVPERYHYDTINNSLIRILDESSDNVTYIILEGRVNEHTDKSYYRINLNCLIHEWSEEFNGNIHPYLKEGEWIIHKTQGTKAWQYKMVDWPLGYTPFTNMRWATEEEIKEASAPATKFKEGDIVVGKNGINDMICKVNGVEGSRISSTDFPGSWAREDHYFRAANALEIHAYYEGFNYLDKFKYAIERDAMKRFPSPASFISAFGGGHYHNIEYEKPVWCGDILMLGKGIIYSFGKWAKPVYGQTDVKPYDPPRDLRTYSGFISCSSHVDKVNDKSEGFSQEEYDTNPMNKKMEIQLPAKKSIIPVAYLIKF